MVTFTVESEANWRLKTLMDSSNYDKETVGHYESKTGAHPWGLRNSITSAGPGMSELTSQSRLGIPGGGARTEHFRLMHLLSIKAFNTIE